MGVHGRQTNGPCVRVARRLFRYTEVYYWHGEWVAVAPEPGHPDNFWRRSGLPIHQTFVLDAADWLDRKTTA